MEHFEFDENLDAKVSEVVFEGESFTYNCGLNLSVKVGEFGFFLAGEGAVSVYVIVFGELVGVELCISEWYNFVTYWAGLLI